MKYKSLDRMIELGIKEMHGDPWMGSDEYMNTSGLLSYRLAWDELHNIHGQIIYKDEIFVVAHSNGSRGMGGMDEGSPPSVMIYRVVPRSTSK